MSRSRQWSIERLRVLLQAGGPLTVREVVEREGVAQPTVSRRLAELGDAVVRIGAARRTRYAIRRALNGEDRWPVFRVDEKGAVADWATLHALHNGWYVEWARNPPHWLVAAGASDGFWEGFPFFLGDVRPQGFLGRRLARRLETQAAGLPGDPTRWSDDQILEYLAWEGSDLPGDLLVGDYNWGNHSLSLHEKMNVPVWHSSDLGRLAEQTMEGRVPGSSAGGEQPKLALWFATDAGPRHVLAKFSPPMDTAVGRRWADLLAAEAHAAQVLAEINLTGNEVGIVDVDRRRFLIVPRFDRVGERGRRGVVSLEALVGTFGDVIPSDWIRRGERLLCAGVLDTPGLEVVRRLASFGTLIGNTDMHAGNLAFWFDDTLPFRPAPAYDMLPMLWAPTAQGELRSPAFAPLPPLPAMQPVWHEAARLAEDFWRRVAADSDRISPDFRAIADQAGQTVERLRRQFG